MTSESEHTPLDPFEERLLRRLLDVHGARQTLEPEQSAIRFSGRKRIARRVRQGVLIAVGGLLVAGGTVAATDVGHDVQTDLGTVTVSPRDDGACVGVPVNSLVRATGCSSADTIRAGRAVLRIGNVAQPKALVGIAPDGVDTVALPDGSTATVMGNVWTATTKVDHAQRTSP